MHDQSVNTAKVSIRDQRTNHVWVVYRLPGEELRETFRRAIKYRGEGIAESGQCCKTFTCGTDEVTICLPKLVGETERACLDRVDAAIVIYRQEAGC